MKFPSLPPLAQLPHWLLVLGPVLCALLAFAIIRTYLTSVAIRLFKQQGLTYNQKHEKGIMVPFGLTAFFALTYYGHQWLLAPGSLVQTISSRLSLIGLTLAAVWATVNFVDIFFLYCEKKAQKTHSKFDDALVPLLRSGAKLVVIAVGLVFVGHSLTFDIRNIIAGLGVGGIAFALAAKDTLSNLFGSLTVILDRPFEIGDWVTFGNGVEGTVLRVGLRSTRIKTFYDSEVAIPNNQLTNMHVDNYGRRKYRRFTTKIGLQYDTPPEKIEAFCEGIRKLILERPHTRKNYFHVYFNEMASSSLNILLYVFWEVKDWSQELTERHRLLIDILRLAKTMEVEFAFPTQTLHLLNQDPHETKTIGHNFHEEGQKLAQEIAQKRISPLNSRSSEDEAKRPPLD